MSGLINQKNVAVIPGKLKNGGKIDVAEKFEVVLNAYPLKLKMAVEKVYKYELKMTAIKEVGKPRELFKGPKNDVAKQERIQLLWELYSQLLKENPDFFGGKDKLKTYTYDCGVNFYSINKLHLKEREMKAFKLDHAKLSEKSQVYLGKRVTVIEAELLCCVDSLINLKSSDAVLENGDRSALQFLEILSNQELLKIDDYYIFASKMFEKSSVIGLRNDPRVLKQGMQKNIRFIGDSIQNADPVVQIYPKKAAFFPVVTLDRFLSDFLPGRENLERKIFSGNSLTQARKQVKDLIVVTTHLKGTQRSFAVSSISDKAANRMDFDYKGQNVSVAKYYEQVYSLRLRYPDLPCAVEKARGDRKNDAFYPLEILKIVDGQRVSINKQSPALVENLIKNCQLLPSGFRAGIADQKEKACLDDRNPFYKAHKVGIDSNLIEADASVLFPPAIIYPRGNDEPDQSGRLNWRMAPNRHYLIPAVAPSVWAAVIVQNGVPPNDCMEFIKKIVNSAQSRGVQICQPKRYELFESSDIEYVREKFAFFKKNSCKFVMFVTRDKLDPVHHTFKLMEIEFGITTQHISSQTMNKAIGDRGAYMVLDNILLKSNLKLGGVNHGLGTARANRQFKHDEVGKEWLGASRMFFGIDVSHPPAQSLFEREKGIAPSSPTIVGMAYTLGHPVDINGTYWMQQPRIAHVEDLKQKLVEAILIYKGKVGCLPRHLVVFRGGVSEGEYRKVLDYEQQAFNDAFEQLEKMHSDFKVPALTIVVVQCKSNYRIVPSKVNPNAKAIEQNVRPGTCLDKGVMHPNFTEFLIVPHKAIQGTANPARCTVIYDSTRGRMSLEEIENVTNCLCYAHGIVTSPVSVPAPLYSASDLAKRGMNNWKTHTFGADEHSSSDSRFINRGNGDAFFSDMSLMLKPVIPTKFWA